MKFLHISDLHIGKSVNGFSMLDEQRRAFEQVIDYIRAERPAALVIAGDVYDRAVPGVEAVRLFDDFLTELARENIAVLLISGNHDSPERLNYASRLLEDKRLYIRGAPDALPRKVVLTDGYGGVNFWLLPFVKLTSARGAFDGREIETLDDAVRAALETAGIDYGARNVLVSHQYYKKTGVEPDRSDSETDPLGGLDAVDAGIIEAFDYAALGHLHKPQTAGAEHIRYSGSPVKYSFSEWKRGKSVTRVELREKGVPPVITALPLAPLHDMREITGPLDKLLSAEVADSADREDYLRVILTDEEEIVDPMGKLRSVYPNVMVLDFKNRRTGADAGSGAADAETLARLSLRDLFGEFFLDERGETMSAEQERIVRETIRELSETEGGE